MKNTSGNITINMPNRVRNYLEKYCAKRHDISKIDFASAMIGYGSCVLLMHDLHADAAKQGLFEKKPKEGVRKWEAYKTVWQHANSVDIIAQGAKEEFYDGKSTCIALHTTAYELVARWCNSSKGAKLGDMANQLLWYGFVHEQYSLSRLQDENHSDFEVMAIARVWSFADEDRLVKDRVMSQLEILQHCMQKAYWLRSINPEKILVGRDALIRVLRKSEEPGAYEKIWHLDDFLDNYQNKTKKK